MPDLKAITIYLTHEEAFQLDAEAQETGRSGVSAQVRYLLELRRRAIDAKINTNSGTGGGLATWLIQMGIEPPS